MPFDADKEAAKAVDQCVTWMQNAAEHQPVWDPGKWQIDDAIIGRSAIGMHRPPYSQFLSSFKKQLEGDKDSFNKHKGLLKRLSRHIGIHARFLAEAADPNGTISKEDLKAGLDLAKAKCRALLRLAKRRKSVGDPKIFQVWCMDYPLTRARERAKP